MKKRLLSLSLSLVAVSVYLILNSYSTGITGVAQGGCTCHSSDPSASTIISLTGLPSTGYLPNTTYTLTVTAINTEISEPLPRDGFDLIASDGSFTAVSGTATSGDNEIHHTSPQVAVNGIASWTFTWTSPATSSLPITFDLACNCTNGDGINGADDQWNNTNIVLPPAAAGTTLELKLFLEGYYTSSSLMNAAIFNQGYGIDPLETDSIQVELKDPLTNATVSTQHVSLGVDGIAICDFNNITGSYYVVISHRNSVQTWSADPVELNSGLNSYDFTTSANQAYGGNLKEVEPNIFAIYGGDLNQDENLDLLDISEVELDISNFEFGHFPTDMNGDGNVDLLDSPILEANVSNFIFASHP